MSTRLFILAGGMGTRLGSITKKIPKALVCVAGQPFLSWQLAKIKSQGISNITFCLGHFAEQIENVCGDGTKFGLNITYSYDGKTLIGTGGALRKALSKYKCDAALVMYGDSYLPINYRDVIRYYSQNEQDDVMTVFRNHDDYDKSNVTLKSNRVSLYSKDQPNCGHKYIDYGLSVINRKNFLDYKTNLSFDLSDYFNHASKTNRLIAFETKQRFYEIGKPEGLDDFANYLSKTGVDSLGIKCLDQ